MTIAGVLSLLHSTCRAMIYVLIALANLFQTAWNVCISWHCAWQMSIMKQRKTWCKKHFVHLNENQTHLWMHECGRHLNAMKTRLKVLLWCCIRLSGLIGVEREEAWKAFHLPRTKEEAVTQLLMEDVQRERVAHCLFQISKILNKFLIKCEFFRFQNV